METKKSLKAELEKKKGIFLQIGFVVILSIVLIAFEWTTKPRLATIPTTGDNIETDMEEIIRTYRNEPKPPPIVPYDFEKILIIDNEIEPDDELNIIDTEIDELTRVIDLIKNDEEDYEDNIPHAVVEEEPRFQGGGENAFRKYLADNLIYPKDAYENGIQGTVLVQFCINSKGKLVDAKIIRSIDPALDEEALRVLNSSPLWTPGKQYGKTVKVSYSFPVNFVLQN